MKFHRLTVLGPTNRRTNDRRIIFKMKCDCGNIIFIPLRQAKLGNTGSCGCLRKEVSAKSVLKVQHLAAKAAGIANRKHGMRMTRFYAIWHGMLERCKNPSIKNYGAKGITVCDRWLKFENFRDDMYKSYLEHCEKFGENRKGTSIDRINGNGNYIGENCRWATAKEQRNNISTP